MDPLLVSTFVGTSIGLGLLCFFAAAVANEPVRKHSAMHMQAHGGANTCSTAVRGLLLALDWDKRPFPVFGRRMGLVSAVLIIIWSVDLGMYVRCLRLRFGL
jgi:hypothetical protein